MKQRKKKPKLQKLSLPHQYKALPNFTRKGFLLNRCWIWKQLDAGLSSKVSLEREGENPLRGLIGGNT